jgi:hypothetical protein
MLLKRNLENRRRKTRDERQPEGLIMLVLAATDFMRHFDPLLNVIHGQIIAKKLTLYRFLIQSFILPPCKTIKAWLPWTEIV